jgi:hypothetical protein
MNRLSSLSSEDLFGSPEFRRGVPNLDDVLPLWDFDSQNVAEGGPRDVNELETFRSLVLFRCSKQYPKDWDPEDRPILRRWMELKMDSSVLLMAALMVDRIDAATGKKKKRVVGDSDEEDDTEADDGTEDDDGSDYIPETPADPAMHRNRAERPGSGESPGYLPPEPREGTPLFMPAN